MIIRDLQTLLELPTLRKDKARRVASFEGVAIRRMRRSEPELPDTAALKAEFRDWLDGELVTLSSQRAQAIRGYLDDTLRKADVEALGVSRAYFDKLLKRLVEKWLRVSL